MEHETKTYSRINYSLCKSLNHHQVQKDVRRENSFSYISLADFKCSSLSVRKNKSFTTHGESNWKTNYYLHRIMIICISYKAEIISISTWHSSFMTKYCILPWLLLSSSILMRALCSFSHLGPRKWIYEIIIAYKYRIQTNENSHHSKCILTLIPLFTSCHSASKSYNLKCSFVPILHSQLYKTLMIQSRKNYFTI